MVFAMRSFVSAAGEPNAIFSLTGPQPHSALADASQLSRQNRLESGGILRISLARMISPTTAQACSSPWPGDMARLIGDSVAEYTDGT